MPGKFPSPDVSEQKKRFTDIQTDKRNYEHLTKEDDHISEQDISNVKTDDSLFIETDHSPAQEETVLPEKKNDDLMEEEKAGEEKIKDNSDTDIDTSWNILES